MADRKIRDHYKTARGWFDAVRRLEWQSPSQMRGFDKLPDEIKDEFVELTGAMSHLVLNIGEYYDEQDEKKNNPYKELFS